jgi:hypothetical protein
MGLFGGLTSQIRSKRGNIFFDCKLGAIKKLLQKLLSVLEHDLLLDRKIVKMKLFLKLK